MIRPVLLFLFSFLLSVSGKASDIILQDKAGTTLNPVQLFKDSTYDYPTGQSFLAGHLFEVIGETVREYEDDSQNQKFKWYQVKTPAGQTGWIYGDALAVMVRTTAVPAELKHFHKQKFSFDNGFENAIVWVAMIEGRDNFHQQDYLNPPYSEKYLVITNADNRSVHINIGGVNARGKYELAVAQLADATGDGISDFIIQMNSFPVNKKIVNRNLIIHSFQAGNLKKIFEERINLTYTDDIPSPAMYKHIEITNQTIRVAYPDYINCKNYQLPYDTRSVNPALERCLEYVTYTLQWNERLDQFKPLYKPTRTPIVGTVKYQGISLLENPTITSRKLGVLELNTELKVIKHYERKVRLGQREQLLTYLLVQLPNGKQGYILADRIKFLQIEHANVLARYYTHPSVEKNNWRVNQTFVNIRSLPDTSVSHK